MRTALLITGSLLALGLAAWLWRSAESPAQPVASSRPAEEPAAVAPSPPEAAEASGSASVTRPSAAPATPASPPSASAPGAEHPADLEQDEPITYVQYPGINPRLDPNANAQVASVVEAARTGKHPERLSSLVLPKPFDRAAYAANPRAYLDVIEPGRVFQSAAPGPGVPVLDSLGAEMLSMSRGTPVELKVKAAPGAPVTYHSSDLGAFDNQLTTITVRSDEQGVAVAQFHATPGTIGDCNITAASPMCSGRINFFVTIEE
jgi:hypothetical protein